MKLRIYVVQMGNPNCCFMIIAGTFFFSSQLVRGTVSYIAYDYWYPLYDSLSIVTCAVWEIVRPSILLSSCLCRTDIGKVVVA